MEKISTKDITFCAMFIALTTVGAYIHIPLPLDDYYSLLFIGRDTAGTGIWDHFDGLLCTSWSAV